MAAEFFSLQTILALHIMSVPPGERTALVQLAMDIAHENNA